MKDLWTESPAAALKAELAKAGVPVRVVHCIPAIDRVVFRVFFSDGVTSEQVAAAAELITAAEARASGGH